MDEIVRSLIEIANVLKNGFREPLWKSLLLPLVTGFGGAIMGAVLSSCFTSMSDKKRLARKNLEKFYKDFNGFFAKVHAIYQEIYNYNNLLVNLKVPMYRYDFKKSHYDNIQNVQNVEKEYEKFVMSNTGKTPNMERYWKLVHNTCEKLLAFDFIIDIVTSMNENAQVSVMFVEKPIKKAFDSLINKTYILSANNFKEFNIEEYRLDVLAILQAVRNELDPKKQPIYLGTQSIELEINDTARIAHLSNLFTVTKITDEKITCKNARGVTYTFNKNELEIV